MYGNNEDGGNGLDFTAGDENQNLEVQEIARCVPSMSVPSLNVKCERIVSSHKLFHLVH